VEISRPGGFVLTLKADPEEFGAAPSRDLTASLEAVLGKGTVRYRARPKPTA